MKRRPRNTLHTGRKHSACPSFPPSPPLWWRTWSSNPANEFPLSVTSSWIHVADTFCTRPQGPSTARRPAYSRRHSSPLSATLRSCSGNIPSSILLSPLLLRHGFQQFIEMTSPLGSRAISACSGKVFRLHAGSWSTCWRRASCVRPTATRRHLSTWTPRPWKGSDGRAAITGPSMP